MSDSADEIRRQMRDIRRDVGADVDGIVHSAHELSDWRYYVRRFPWLAVGSAFAVGMLAAPKPRRLLQQLDKREGVDFKHLLSKWRKPEMPEMPAAAPLAALGASGLAMKLLGVLGPIAARSAASMILSRIGGHSSPDEEDLSHFQQVGKPR